MLCLSLIAPAEQQVDDTSQQDYRYDGANPEGRLAGEQSADLEYDQGHHVGETAHIADSAQGPLGVIHLTFDSAHGGEQAAQAADTDCIPLLWQSHRPLKVREGITIPLFCHYTTKY